MTARKEINLILDAMYDRMAVGKLSKKEREYLDKRLEELYEREEKERNEK